MNFRVEDSANIKIDLNRVMLHGKIISPIILRYTESGESVARFELLVNGHVTEDKLDQPNYFLMVVWG